MRIVFISNTNIVGFQTILIKDSSEINDSLTEQIEDEFKKGDTVFVISVHCRFKKFERAQQQGGVKIYRLLLDIFKNCQDKLKVVFYSPISQTDLVRLEPENYILRLLPFIELFQQIKDSEGNRIDDEECAFENELRDLISADNFPQFNSASENLLSGWALYNSKEIEEAEDNKIKLSLQGKSLLIVDDEFVDWKNTYLTIFDLKSGEIMFPPYDSQIKFREAWDDNEALNKICNGAEYADAVLSDLYIRENHEETNPYKTKNDIEKISGFNVMKIIRKKHPYLPYMMFTSSNKVWNSEAFRSEGIWAWAVKENGASIVKSDKIAQFLHFRDCILKITQREWKYVSDTWKMLLSCYKNNGLYKYWWNENSGNPRETEAQKKTNYNCWSALKILKDCLFVMDLIYSQRASFEKKLISDFAARQCFQIMNNLGGICEMLEIKDRGRREKTAGIYVYALRSFYSHKLFYKSADIIETIFCINLILKLLMLDSKSFDQQPRNDIESEKHFRSRTNVNYFLQLEEIAKQNPGLSYDQELFDELKLKFSRVKDKNWIISTVYEKTANANQKVIDLIDAHTNQVP